MELGGIEMVNNTSILFFESNVDWIHFICVK